MTPEQILDTYQTKGERDAFAVFYDKKIDVEDDELEGVIGFEACQRYEDYYEERKHEEALDEERPYKPEYHRGYYGGV